MPGSKSDYLEKAVLDFVLGAGTFAKPVTVFVALSTAAYSDAATGSALTEVTATGTAYARVAVTNNAVNFPAATGTSPASKSNAVAVTFPTATASWGTIASFYITDATSLGNVLYGGDLTTAKLIASGDTATFAATAIVITED